MKEGFEILFLQEIKLIEKKFERLKFQLGYHDYLAIDMVGCSGGLSLMWKSEVDLSICSYSTSHIDALIVKDRRGRRKWQLTGVYRQPNIVKRHETWNLLKSLRRDGTHAWLVFGDFNEILSKEEEYGGRARPRKQMMEFKDAINEGQFIDLGYAR